MSAPGHHDDFAVEPIPGLPARPPRGEHILWRGAPDWRMLAVTALHVRKAFGWFALLGLWQVAQAWHDGVWTRDVPFGVAVVAAMSLVTAGILCGIAVAMARTTVYTITDRRVVIRFGMALPMTINVPFAEIDGASLRSHGEGFGDISLTLQKKAKISAAVLWPHVRPWRWGHPQPMLRCIPDAANVAVLLAEAFGERQPATISLQRPVSAPVGMRPALQAAE